MKKTLLSLLALMATATTQAQDMKIFKAESLMEEKNYNEAVAVIKECISNPKDYIKTIGLYNSKAENVIPPATSMHWKRQLKPLPRVTKLTKLLTTKEK